MLTDEGLDAAPSPPRPLTRTDHRERAQALYFARVAALGYSLDRAEILESGALLLSPAFGRVFDLIAEGRPAALRSAHVRAALAFAAVAALSDHVAECGQEIGDASRAAFDCDDVHLPGYYVG